MISWLDAAAWDGAVAGMGTGAICSELEGKFSSAMHDSIRKISFPGSAWERGPRGSASQYGQRQRYFDPDQAKLRAYPLCLANRADAFLMEMIFSRVGT